MYLTTLVVFHLYGKISLHPGEILFLVRWDFTILVVLCSSCKRKMKIQRILLEGGTSPLSLGSGLASEVFSSYKQALSNRATLDFSYLMIARVLPTGIQLLQIDKAPLKSVLSLISKLEENLTNPDDFGEILWDEKCVKS